MARIVLPKPPAPAGGYAPVVIRRGIGFVSGQFPFRHGELAFHGRVGAELTVEEGREACRIAALNVLAQIDAATGAFADLDGLLRLDGYVASADDFHAQPMISMRRRACSSVPSKRREGTPAPRSRCHVFRSTRRSN